MQVENIFPNPILKFSIDTTSIENSLAIAKDYAKEADWFEAEHYGQSLTSFFSDGTKNYLGTKDSNLAHEIINAARCYLDGIGWHENADLVMESWLNLNPYSTWHGAHEHFDSLMSGVVWLQTNQDSGAHFVFIEPNSVKTQIFLQYSDVKLKDNEFNRSTYTINPKSGEGVIFPSWMTHQVLPNKSKEYRYSIAFNIWIDKNGKN